MGIQGGPHAEITPGAGLPDQRHRDRSTPHVQSFAGLGAAVRILRKTRSVVGGIGQVGLVGRRWGSGAETKCWRSEDESN